MSDTLQAERLARKAQQANARNKARATPEPPPYQVIAPYIPESALHRDQRYFSRGNTNRSFELKSGRTDADWRGNFIASSAAVEVYRHASDDTAELQTEVRIGGNACEARVRCTADELREIAYRLLDAAHDLEINPSSTLMREAA